MKVHKQKPMNKLRADIKLLIITFKDYDKN